jgi:sulfide:quinone oxidoreductase
MQSLVRPNIFVIGDAANIGVWKAGSVAYFEGDALVANVLHFIHGETLDASYDGHINGFIESGFGKALLIDFNYDTEPMAGRFPGTVGFPLLKESRLNHWGRVAFEWMYWHAVLAGRHIPGIRSKMPTAGKRPELGGAPRLRPISRSTEEPKPEKVS